MRTTIRLDDALLRRAKAYAAARGRSLNDFVADAVRMALAARPAGAAPVDLPTFGGGRVQPGVDLDDSAALLDLMDEAEPSRDAREANQSATRRVAEQRRRPGR